MATLESCRSQLRSIISELRDIESGLRSGFAGIGESYYSNSVGRIAEKYEGVLRTLNSMDTNFLTKVAEGLLGNGEEN